jgi:hypothetical protein
MVFFINPILGPGNELEYAKIPDSSYYDTNLIVNLEQFHDNYLERSFSLRDTFITDKDSGMFYFPEQKLYCTREKLDAVNYYKLKIVNTATGKLIESGTMLVDDFTLLFPNLLSEITIVPGRGSEVKWISASGGKRYQLTMKIQYFEYEIGQVIGVEKFLEWVPFKNFKSKDNLGGTDISYFIPGNEFYSFLGNHLESDPNLVRVIGKCKFTFLVGSDDLDKYLELSQVSGSNIQAVPLYSNIINGIGLFASRHSVLFDSLQFSQTTRDSLKTNAHTKDLGFLKDVQ